MAVAYGQIVSEVHNADSSAFVIWFDHDLVVVFHL